MDLNSFRVYVSLLSPHADVIEERLIDHLKIQQDQICTRGTTMGNSAHKYTSYNSVSNTLLLLFVLRRGIKFVILHVSVCVNMKLLEATAWYRLVQYVYNLLIANLVPRLRMSGALPLLPQYAFVAWTGKSLLFS